MKRTKLFYGAPAEGFGRAKLLRRNMTRSEKLLWNHLSDNQLGYRFRRQHPIGLFIADFYCHKAQLVVEVDGAYHRDEKQLAKDHIRTQEMMLLGIKQVLRFTDEQVNGDIRKVVDEIKERAHHLAETIMNECGESQGKIFHFRRPGKNSLLRGAGALEENTHNTVKGPVYNQVIKTTTI